MSIEALASWIDCTALRHGAKSANSDNKMRSAAASDGMVIECGHILLDEIWWSRNLAESKFENGNWKPRGGGRLVQES